MTQAILRIDLDGTLIHTDMHHESAFGLLKAAPLSVLKLPWVLLTKSKAELKPWIAKQVGFDQLFVVHGWAWWIDKTSQI